MYLEFHGFREKPFNLTPDPRFVFLSKTHKEAFAHILYGIDQRAGFISLTGEVGSGKTTVLRSLLNQFDTDHHRTALIFNPYLSPTELLQTINREFGIQADSSNHSNPLEALNLFLLQQNAEGRTVVLVIDEAQNLELPVLEQIRLISNLETDHEKLIQIILSGQPEFLNLIEKNELRQLSQRITVRYHLRPMDFQDTSDYIQHRIDIAGGKASFSGSALKQIFSYSRGLPRMINAVCDRALLVGYTRNTNNITSQIASLGIKDLKKDRSFQIWKKPFVWISILTVLAALVAGGIYWNRSHSSKINQIAGEKIEGLSALPVQELSFAEWSKLWKVSEAESTRGAFNRLAGLWHVPPVLENDPLNPQMKIRGIEYAALGRGLKLYSFFGNLGALLRLGYPAVIELALPKQPEKRFVTLVGADSRHLFIEPAVAGRKTLSFNELEMRWTGQGFILWKDVLNLLTDASPVTQGPRVKQLQGLLRDAGTYSGPLTGVYDSQTISAVKTFQTSVGIKEDGIAGTQTLMALYGSVNRFGIPRLRTAQK